MITPGLRFCGAWLHPALLLGVSAHLYAGAAVGLPAALLLVLAPCLVLLARQTEPADEANLLVVVLFVLATVFLLAANLLLIGDITSALGAPRWYGVMIAAGCAFTLTILPSADRWWPLLAPGALTIAWFALVAVAQGAGVGPAAAWSDVASRPSFGFAPASRWVASGGEFATSGSLVFTEPHTLTAVSPDVFGVIVSDGPAPSAQEWRPVPGEAITLRPGDRLSYPAGARLRFESGKRVPGAPLSGIAWADPTARAPLVMQLVESLGLALTLVAGSVPLLRAGAPASRTAAAAGLAMLLAGVAWAEGWAVYAGWTAPDISLGGGRAGALVLLPDQAIGGLWGRRLSASMLAAVIALFAAGASALRERVAALDRGGGDLGRDVPLWIGVFGVAVVASLWPRDPWSVLLIGFGLLASTLGPLALGSPGAPAPTRALACWIGLAAFVAVGLGGRAIGGALAHALAAYPALAGAPAAWIALRLARSRPA